MSTLREPRVGTACLPQIAHRNISMQNRDQHVRERAVKIEERIAENEARESSPRRGESFNWIAGADGERRRVRIELDVH